MVSIEDSDGCRTGVPVEAEHSFRLKANTRSDEAEQRFRGKPNTSETMSGGGGRSVAAHVWRRYSQPNPCGGGGGDAGETAIHRG